MGPTAERSSEVEELSPEDVGDSEFVIAVIDISNPDSSSPTDSLLIVPETELVLEGLGADNGLPELEESSIFELSLSCS